MMREKIILAVDAGTGDCRVIAFALDGSIRYIAKHEWVYDKTEDNAFTFDAQRCWDEILSMLKETLAHLSNGEIAAVTVTSQRDGMVFLDSWDKEVYCAPNMDLRGEEVLDELRPCQEEILVRTGLPLHAMFGLPRLVYYRKHYPQVYADIRCVLMLCDWIAWRLSGEKRSERAAASSSQMLNLESGEYDPDLMAHLGLPTGIFPRCTCGTEVIGMMRSAIAAELGLSYSVPVLIGGGDTQSGAVGMNALHCGDIGVVGGTTTPVLAVMDRPYVDREAHVYTSCGALKGQWILEACADSTGLSLRWVRDLFMPSGGSFSDMEEEAKQVVPGCDGMSAYIGVGIRDENRGRNWGGFCFPVPWNVSDYTRAHFFRAAFESNAFGVTANLEVLRRKGIHTPDRLHVCGGQSQTKLWDQILADTTQIPVQTYKNTECTALGAAAMAAFGIGVFGTLEEAVNAFSEEDVLYIPDKNSNYPAIYTEWLRLHRHMIAFQ